MNLQLPSLKEVGVIVKRIDSTMCISVSPWKKWRHAFVLGKRDCLTPDVLVRFYKSKIILNSRSIAQCEDSLWCSSSLTDSISFIYSYRVPQRLFFFSQKCCVLYICWNDHDSFAVFLFLIVPKWNEDDDYDDDDVRSLYRHRFCCTGKKKKISVFRQPLYLLSAHCNFLMQTRETQRPASALTSQSCRWNYFKRLWCQHTFLPLQWSSFENIQLWKKWKEKKKQVAHS